MQLPSVARDELQRALVRFYAAIMIYLSKAKSYFDQNTIGKFANLMIEYMLTTFAVRRIKSGLLPRSDIESSFDAIATAQEIVDRCAALVGMKRKNTHFLATLFI